MKIPFAGKLNVLILDDEQRFTEELSEYLHDLGFTAYEAHTGQQGYEQLRRHAIDLLILDVRLPGINGLDVLKKVKSTYPTMEVIVVSAHGDMDTVIKAMRLGAIDYLRKPFRHIDIRIAIERTQKFLHLQRDMKQLQEHASLISKSLEERIERHFIGTSAAIKKVLDLAITAAQFPDTNVLITGDSGVGKENVARIIHFDSTRHNHIFCAVNSSSISDSLMESEFFGHKKGSFTGAVCDKKGYFEISHNGTLFLDEIADMPSGLQAKMLRALEEKSFTRVGETKPIKTNFRIISATNHNLDKLIDEKKFRLDLMHRLNTLHINIPPLRDRTEDIEPLLMFFISDLSKKLNKPAPRIEKCVIDKLKSYSFPGNVRELKNLCERAIILCKDCMLKANDFPVKFRSKTAGAKHTGQLNIDENEASLIRLALHNCNYNQSEAARELGIHRMALARKMQKYGISSQPKEKI